jgi:hypothetical protein
MFGITHKELATRHQYPGKGVSFYRGYSVISGQIETDIGISPLDMGHHNYVEKVFGSSFNLVCSHSVVILDILKHNISKLPDTKPNKPIQFVAFKFLSLDTLLLWELVHPEKLNETLNYRKHMLFNVTIPDTVSFHDILPLLP